jgi:RimJ/RimL family protein N-acetyltransferase
MERITLGESQFIPLTRVVELRDRLRRYAKQRGIVRTAYFLATRLFRRERHIVYQATAATPMESVQWPPNYKVLQFGPDNLEAGLTSALRAYLGGDEAVESLRGVRNGDQLFVITDGVEYFHRGYIMFNTRQSRLLGDQEGCPLIGYCSTDPSARGRGLYQKALRTEVAYLLNCGWKRVLIETDPANVASRRGIEAAGFVAAWESTAWILLNTVVLRRNRDLRGRIWRLFVI